MPESSNVKQQRASARKDAPKSGAARGLFFKATLPDFILVLAVSVAVGMTALFAFNVSTTYSTDVVFTSLAMALLLVIMFAGSYSRRLLPVSIVLTVIVAIVYLVIGVNTSFGTDLLQDVPENRLIIAIVWAVTPVIVYLLSRKPLSLAFLLAITIATCAVVEYLYQGYLLRQFFVAFAGIVLLFVFQTYRSSVSTARRAKGSHFFSATLFSLGIGAVLVGLATAVFFVFIAPMELSEVEIKLFQEEYALETVEYTSTYKTEETEDPDNRSSNTGIDQQKTNNNDSTDSEQETSSGYDRSLGDLLAGALSAFDPDNNNDDYQNIGYERLRLGLLIALAVIVALLVVAVLIWRSRRSARLKKLAGKTNAERVVAIFNFLVGRLERLGFRRPAHMTAGEYAVSSYRSMKSFSRDTANTSFLNVTETFYRAYYGGLPVSNDEYAGVERFYRQFFRNARRYVGLPKWVLWKFWRI